MKTFQQFNKGAEQIPVITSWSLNDIAESKGKQQLFSKQSPQKLKALREHAMIESAVSSNRIEGVEVEPGRIKTVLLGKAALKDRDEEEVRGYRDALKLIHEKGEDLPVSEETIKKLHRLARAKTGDAGKYKAKDGDIIEKYPDGRIRVRFKTVTAASTPEYMDQLILNWNSYMQERRYPPLILMAAFNLDFLCIHPFRDGNGRVSRLLMLQQCYQMGLEVGRYVSLEKLIERHKERYYETLEQSSQKWHEGKHDPWPYINYVLFIIREAYQEFEARLDSTKEPRGAKTEVIKASIDGFVGKFTLADLERACPGVSRDMVRKVLRDLKKSGQLNCLGHGPGAFWEKKGNNLK